MKAVRQTYHVFEAEGYFFVLNFALSKARRGSGYFNAIDTQAVDYVQRRLGGVRGSPSRRSKARLQCALRGRLLKIEPCSRRRSQRAPFVSLKKSMGMLRTRVAWLTETSLSSRFIRIISCQLGRLVT